MHRPRILFVDDEPKVLSAIVRSIGNRYRVETATDANAAISLLESDQSFTVIVSDLRMPGMDGVRLLAKVKALSPDTVRILLSGHADVTAAVKAVNEGQVFRFLLKPCVTTSMMAALADAVEQHRLITSERVLLEQTLSGSIAALVDLLAITQPASFGRATRLKRFVESLSAEMGIRNNWALGVAALLSQVGYIIVPAETAGRAHRGEPMTVQEEALLESLPAFAEQLVASIPRLEPVRQILRLQYDSAALFGEDRDCIKGAELLRATKALDLLESRGRSSADAIDDLEKREYVGPDVLNAMRRVCGLASRSVLRVANAANDELAAEAPLEHNRQHSPTEVVESARLIEHLVDGHQTMPLADVRLGMYFAADVTVANGVLLVARGQEVTNSLLQRIDNSWRGFASQLQVKMVVSEVEQSTHSTGFQRVV